jgi:hypothetical protein
MRELMKKEFVFGFCPLCGAPGSSRERRQDGNDKCTKGHGYPSKNSVNRECIIFHEDGSSEHTIISKLKIGDKFTLNDGGHKDGSEDGSRIYVASSYPYLINGVDAIETAE